MDETDICANLRYLEHSTMAHRNVGYVLPVPGQILVDRAPGAAYQKQEIEHVEARECHEDSRRRIPPFVGYSS